MTDKQIIIDGVDVSGCAYFGSTMFPTKNCTMYSEYLHSCESCYCYYKQLKKAMNQIVELNKKVEAKEQECEELKEKVKKYGEINEQETKDYAELKAELEQEKALKETYFACYHAKHEDLAKKYDQLKAEGDLAKQLINWILKFFELTDYDWQDDQNEISALIEDYIDDKNSTIDFVNDINKGLFKKLTEIKEIAEVLITMTDEYDNCYYKDKCSKCEVKEDCQYFKVEQILQKISECEGNDENN